MSQHNTRPQNVSGNILEHCTLAYIYGELLTSDTAVQTDSVNYILPALLRIRFEISKRYLNVLYIYMICFWKGIFQQS